METEEGSEKGFLGVMEQRYLRSILFFNLHGEKPGVEMPDRIPV